MARFLVAALAACVLMLQQAAAQYQFRMTHMVFRAGWEPHRAKGERGLGEPRKCQLGSYKAFKGAYPCKKCEAGSIAPKRGAIKCQRCHPIKSMTSNSARTACISVTQRGSTGEEARETKAAAPAWLTKYRASLVKQRATIYYKSKSCDMEESGSMRCGINVGYQGSSRSGSVFLPAAYKDKSFPYMLLWHGSGWTGSDMINVFKQYAIQYGYGIVAPDSHNAMFWSSPDTASDPWTSDWYHVQACWNSVMKMPHVKPNARFLSSFGNSRAGYAAVAFASRSPTNFNSAVIIHAAALGTQVGPRSFPILWATGVRDPLYGPSAAVPDLNAFKKITRGRFPITYRVSQTSHTIRNYTEVTGWITWWLKPSTRNAQWNTFRR